MTVPEVSKRVSDPARTEGARAKVAAARPAAAIRFSVIMVQLRTRDSARPRSLSPTILLGQDEPLKIISAQLLLEFRSEIARFGMLMRLPPTAWPL